MLVSATQAAKELGLSINTVREKIRSGEWPIYLLGAKSMRIDVEEIKKLTRRQTDPSNLTQVERRGPEK